MKPSHIKYIVVHCSATPASMDIGVQTIDHWHRSPPRNWSKIGYHFVIRRDGRVEKGRLLDEIGAHAFGYNRVSWGICMIGGLDAAGEPENNFTDLQFASLRSVLMTLTSLAPSAAILGHRDLSPDIDGDGVIEKWEWLKDCPCFNVRAWTLQSGLLAV